VRKGVTYLLLAAAGGLFHAVFDRVAALRDRIPGVGIFTFSRALAGLSVFMMAAIMLNDLFGATPAVSSVEPTRIARPAWNEVARAHGAFALETPALEQLELSYVVRRHRQGGGRKDVMTWGSVSDPGLYVRVSLYRAGAEGMPPAEPIEAVAAVAAESGINAELTGPVGELETKFGPLSMVDMQVWAADGWRACLAVTGSWNEPKLGLVAWWCNPRWDLVQRRQVVCLLDRLMLMSSGGDPHIVSFFARAERNRDACYVSPVLGTTPKRPDDWVFAKAEPKLRGRLSER
jgi:hypothetical protein